MKGYLEMSEKFKGQYLIFKNDIIRKNGRDYIKVKCPCCYEERYIRKTLLNKNNKQYPLSTICHNCSSKTEFIFFKEKEEDSFSYILINNEKVYVDDDILEKIKNLNIQLVKGYAIIKKEKKTIPLHRFVSDADKLGWECVDHINHNTLDNRKINLRKANRRENSLNTKINTKNKTGFKNIILRKEKKNKWYCQYKIYGERTTKTFEHFLDAYNYMYNEKYSKSDFTYSIFQDATKEPRYAGLLFDDLCNGEGVGAVFFTQSCSKKCLGCHNPQTWSKNGGKVFTEDVFNSIIDYFEQTPFAERLTLSGGDPLENLEISNYIASEFKRRFPKNKLWVYTGFTFEELIEDVKYLPILEMTDVLIDGRFEIDKRDLSLKFKGSSNQRVIDVKKTLTEGKIILYKE